LAINLHYWNKATPLVLTTRNPANKEHLYLEQLSWGLGIQKYETSIDPIMPGARLIFADPVGEQILKEELGGVEEEFVEYEQYAGVALRHLPAVLTIYARHLFNGLDLKYPTPYIQHVYGPTLPLSILNYTVLFLALLVLVHRRHRPLSAEQWLVVSALLMPCLLVVPTAIECRFMLPLHLLLYAIVCFGWPREWRLFFLRWRVGLAYVAFVAACLMLSASTLEHMAYGPRPLWP
jgi:hypothetical protein